jgi:hypothetical protein
MKSKLVLALLATFMSCVALLAYSSAKATQDVQVKFPPGNWSLQHPAISRLGLEDAPLQITSVTGDVKKGGTITAVRLRNNSGKAVTTVKFAWYLFRDQERQKILQKGESPVLGVTGFSDGSSKVVNYSIVSFGNIYKPLVKDGKLTGDFVLEVAVSEINYEDGSKWERE